MEAMEAMDPMEEAMPMVLLGVDGEPGMAVVLTVLLILGI
jgi:hypothetical protein